MVLLIISKLLLWLKVIHKFLDYGDTFSLVAKMAFVRLFVAMEALQRWSLYQLDVKNVFLNREFSGIVCHLHKSLYGYKESPRAWFGKFSNVVQQFGMSRSEADHSIFLPPL